MPINSDSENLLLDVLNHATEEKTLEKQILRLYAASTYLLLSKSFFPSNSDLPAFSEKLLYSLNKYRNKNSTKSIHFGDYVYKSRTVLVSRVIRIIERSDENEVKIIITEISRFVTKPSKKKKNSVDALLDRFGRTK
ncbi:hypothetical protein [Lacticaseibacillus paracasei]|uniref:hypothetical protein n=1 Tax=Lacticaseibacillus paracasei TaxID=1597 RepID=UPI0022E2F893|nr:hypothetical protein [Lacticaseibacillus paracasei]